MKLIGLWLFIIINFIFNGKKLSFIFFDNFTFALNLVKFGNNFDKITQLFLNNKKNNHIEWKTWIYYYYYYYQFYNINLKKNWFIKNVMKKFDF